MGKFETNLILEVELHDCLYNKNSADYRNRTKRAQCWVDISFVLGKSPQECQKKWVNLRDTFFRLYKAQQSLPHGSRSLNNIKWKYFNSIRYLSESSKISSKIVNCKEESREEEVEPVILQKRKEGSYVDTKSANKKMCHQRLEADDNILPVKNVNELYFSSPMQQFFSSIAVQGERLSRRKQLKLQMKCLKSLEEVELEDSD